MCIRDRFLVIPSYYYYEDPQSALHAVAAHVGSKVDESISHAKHANNYPEKQRLIGKVSDDDKVELKKILAADMTKLRDTLCALEKKGMKVGSWDDESERKKHWFFMPEEALKDC